MPISADDVTVLNNHTVTLNLLGAVANSLTIQTGNQSSALNFNAGTSLTVTNNVAVQAPSGGRTKQISVGSSTLTVTAGSITITGGSSNNDLSQVTVTSGSLNVQAGGATVTGGTAGNPDNATLTVSTGTIAIAGNLGVTGGSGGNASATASVTSTGAMTVQGNATLTGGSSANRDALLTVGGTGIITINGGLTINATVAGSSSASITVAGGRITVAGSAGVSNGDTVTVGPGTFTVTDAAATFTNSSATIVASTTVSSGTLDITGNLTNASGETVSISSTGNVSVDGTLSNSGTMSITTTGVVNANGTFTNSGTFTNLASGTLNLGGTATVNGTFNRGTGTVVCNGSSAQSLSGTALTAPATGLNKFTINNASGVTLGNNITVNATLTFTSGKITTGSNNVIIASGATIATPSSSSYIIGNMQKAYAAGASLGYFAGNDFPVGDATNYTPVDITAGTTTTAGSLTVSTTTGDHPQVTTPIASTGIDASKSVNRYWTFNNSGLTVGTAISATFTFVSGDVDGGANTSNFILERYDGMNWFPTTLSAANAANVQVSNITPLASGNNDFAIGEPLSGFTAVPGAFEIFETTSPANSIIGRLYAKIVGVLVTFQVVAVNAGRTGVNTGFSTNPITVDVLDSSDNSGALTAASACRSTWSVIAGLTQSLSPTWTSGRTSTITVISAANNTVARRDVRIRVTQGASVGCSTDRFSIRPLAFNAPSSTNATNTNTSGTPTVKTGANFNLSVTALRIISPATAITGYTGTPSIDNTQIVGTPNAGTIGGSFGAASTSTGVATGSSFYYSEVGNFGLNANAVYEDTFSAVDQPEDCTNDFSNGLSGGKYGCKFGSAAVAQTSGTSGFGRFIPDNFAVSFNTPSFSTTCGTFSYVGQSFAYAAAPVIIVTARNGTSNGLTNATTTNYATSSYVKLTNGSLTPATQSARYSRFDALGSGATPGLDVGGLPAVGSDPTIRYNGDGIGSPPPPPAGQVTLTFSGNLAFTRDMTTPKAPFGADIALAVNVIDGDSVAYAGNPASFGAASSGNGIVFSSGKAFRYGVLRLLDVFAPLAGNSSGNAPVVIQAQYWNGTAFATNTLDSCTSFMEKNFVLFDHRGSITAANLPTPTAGSNGKVSMAVGTLSSGIGRVNVISTSSAPPPINTLTQPGSAHLCLDLDLSSLQTDGTCVAVTPSDKAYLQGPWAGGSYNKDPSATVGFGIYGSQPKNFIYQRENY